MGGRHQEHEGRDPVMIGLSGLTVAVLLGVVVAVIVLVVGMLLWAKFWFGG